MTEIKRENLRTLVRGAYDLQKLRIQMGNRIVANFKCKLGQEPGRPEEEMDDDAKQLLADLRASYRKITDGVKKFPSPAKFQGNELISSYTELCLIAQYLDLERSEKEHFKRLEHILQAFPIYTEFLANIRGIGPAMSGVIISEINIRKAKYVSSTWAYCFPANTLVTTPNGMVPIEALKAGDQVIDATGEITDIKEHFRRSFSGEMVTIEMIGSEPLTLTDEHPVLICREGEAQWLEAKAVIPGDCLMLPKLQASEHALMLPLGEVPAFTRLRSQTLANGIPLTEDLAYLMGLYVADGSATVYTEGLYRRGHIAISLCGTEPVYKESVVGLARDAFGTAYYSVPNDQVSFGRGFLSEKFQEWFGHRAENKRIPAFLYLSPNQGVLRSFLRGYFDGDGHIVKEGKSAGSLIASSASRGLIYQVQAMLARLGLFAPVHTQRRGDGVAVIRGRTIQQRPDRYVLSLPASETAALYAHLVFGGNRKARKVRALGSHFLLPVKSVTARPAACEVFNLHTGSNTYQVRNLAVHNCGLDVGPDGRGRSRRAEHLRQYTYINKGGQEAQRQGITFNPFLKTKLIGVLGSSFLRAGEKDNPYKEIYNHYKHRLENHAEHSQKTKGHRHSMAIRYMVKLFLRDLYCAWKRIEGLPVEPEYSEAKLGRKHSRAA